MYHEYRLLPFCWCGGRRINTISACLVKNLAQLTDTVDHGVLLRADVLAGRELHARVAEVALARTVVLVPGVAVLGMGEVLVTLAREQISATLLKKMNEN